MNQRVFLEKEKQMVKIDVSMTLAEAVDAFPQLAREFEHRGLDYCCGGQRTLGEACALIGLDPAATITDLSQVGASSEPAEWTTMTADDLIDHLEATHHRYLWDELPRVTALVDKIVSVHGDRHPELVDVASCFASLCADLGPHMIKEERALFPMIRELATSTGAPSFHCGSLRNPISVMLSEHDAVGGLLAKLRRLTDGYTPPADGCATYEACFAAMAEIEADTHLHIHKENNVLFPLVVQLGTRTRRAVSLMIVMSNQTLENTLTDIVDRDDIEVLVRNFYRDAAMDDLLDPVFKAAHVRWDAHVATLIDFWAWQLLGEPGYEGQPLRAHEPVHARTPLSHAHYERWMELFCDTIDASFHGPLAEVAKGRGRKMAAAMERLLSGVSASGGSAVAPLWRRDRGAEMRSGIRLQDRV